ncbi:hypothetical protein GCM10009624_27880 [Gordonia sinesedis]
MSTMNTVDLTELTEATDAYNAAAQAATGAREKQKDLAAKWWNEGVRSAVLCQRLEISEPTLTAWLRARGIAR